MALIAPSSSTASQVLRGSQSQTPVRLFPVDKKHSKKAVVGDNKLSGDAKLSSVSPGSGANGKKLSAGSAANAGSTAKNVKKCKKKRVTSSSGAAAATVTDAGVNIFEVADPSLTTSTSSTKTTTSMSASASTSTSSNGKTTTIPTTTGTTTIQTTTGTTTSATVKATEGITSVQGQQRASSVEIPDTIPKEQWTDVCDENGSLVPPNTYYPTASPGNDDFFLMDTAGNEAGNNKVPTKAPIYSGFFFTSDGDTDDGSTDEDISDGNDETDDGVTDDNGMEDRTSPGCNAFANNRVYETSIVANVNFVYEILVDDSGNGVDSILDDLEGKLVKLLGGEMIYCESVRLLRGVSSASSSIVGASGSVSGVDGYGRDGDYKNRRLESQVDGISSSPTDTVTTSPCTHFTSTASSSCHSIQGGMTLYLRENSSSSSASQSSTRALKILMNEFNNNESSFMNDGEYAVNGLAGIRYISGVADEDVGVGHSNNPSTNVGGAASESKNVEENKNLSSVGISLVVMGSALFASLLLVVARKSRREENSADTYDEFYDEDQDLEQKWKDGDNDSNSLNDTLDSTSSHDSPTRADRDHRLATIYNEDESVNAFSIIRELHASEAYAASHGIQDAASVISRKPVFVSTRDDDSVEVYNANQSVYTQSSILTKPTFENPAGMGRGNERRYNVDDTVEL
jgi:hypothetical protein